MKKINKAQDGFIGIALAIVGTIALFVLPIFLALDWTTGSHGRLTITAVDKNLFGTHTVYVRNSESLSGNEMLEVTYCIDAQDTVTAEKAKDSIGKKNTTLVYPDRRIGLFFFDKCKSAPVRDIIVSE